MKTLLVPVDFSESTKLLVEKAAAIAGELGGRIVLLHVTEPMASYVPVGASMDVLTPTPPATEVIDVSVLQERIDAFVSDLRARGLQADGKAISGLAVDDILDQAAVEKADYIVLGSHGHGALFHLFSGSVVTGVLKRAICPVIVVPVRRQS
ncbi:nucleotide-binding universal stress protein, UspA family [Terrimicrobium sacchariphilum]|jgi:nucleotide-binding universal stress UspA family protein|uniref:Nucleotide-binding universal stress protein, UspA family n=1 Tax=Terrimicrobium sacchariphilum TaxID=690879 RepID=A0A146GA13_TERSA|nr:universal stress protein [Terrimicrobium sacchariphilum]GAT34485.1 nucleotide-binding universal stress protein, UspA family [Terrimicrobium sacchariphilum]